MARTSPVHYIAPSSISIIPNANGSADDLALYVAKGAKIKVYSPLSGIDTIDGDYQEWTLSGRNRRLGEDIKPYTIYARLPKDEGSRDSGYIVFAAKTQVGNEWRDKYNYVTADGLTDIEGATTDSDNWYIRLGDVSLPAEGQRTIDYDTGILGTEQFNTEWALNPGSLPLRVELGCTIDNEDAGPTPYVYWGQSLVLTAFLTEGWTSTDIQRFDHWEIARDSGDTLADNTWNGGTSAVEFRSTGSINLQHGRGTGQGVRDDFNSAVSAVFTVNAMENTGTEENPVYAVLKSASICIMAETWEKYELSLSSQMVTYNPITQTYSPNNGVTFNIRATNQKGETSMVTNRQLLDAGVTAQYALVGVTPEVWTLITISGPNDSVAEGVIAAQVFSDNQKSVNIRLRNANNVELSRGTVAFLRDGEDSKEREWIFLRSTEAITFGTQEHPYPASISGGQVNPTGAATGSDTNKNQDDWVPQGWWDEQQGVDATNRFEYGAYRDFVHESGNTPAHWGAFTTPKIWNHYGKDGKNAVRIDLDNQADLISLDSDGKVRFARTVVVHAKIYDGDNPIISDVTNTTTDSLVIGDCTPTVSANNPDGTVSGGVLTITWAFTKGMTAAADEKTIKLTYNSVEYSTVFSLGTTDSDAVYQLKPNKTSLSFGRDANGALTPNMLTAKCGYTKNTGSGDVPYEWPIDAGDANLNGRILYETGKYYYILFRLLDANGVPIPTFNGACLDGWDWTTGYGANRKGDQTTHEYNGEIVVLNTHTYSAVEFGLSTKGASYYIDNVVHYATDADMLDIESVPVVRDGAKGEQGAPGGNTATLMLYKRSATAITQIDWSNVLTYTFATQLLDSVPTGWSLNEIPSGTDPIYVTAATAYSTGATDTIDANEWATPVKYVENGAQGAHGINTAPVFLYQRNNTAPTKPTDTLTYTFDTGLLSGTLGDWSQTIPATDGNPCWVIQATAVSQTNTDTIVSTEWSEQKKLVEDGTDGQDMRENIVDNSEPKSTTVINSRTETTQGNNYCHFGTTDKSYEPAKIPADGSKVSGQARVTLSGCAFKSNANGSNIKDGQPYGHVLLYFQTSNAWPHIVEFDVYDNGVYNVMAEDTTINRNGGEWTGQVLWRVDNFEHNSGTISFERVKLEVGDKCSGWCLSENDKKGRGITSVNTYFKTFASTPTPEQYPSGAPGGSGASDWSDNGSNLITDGNASKHLYESTCTTYTDGTYSWTTPLDDGLIGDMAATEEQFALADSSTAAPAESSSAWQTSVIPTAGKWIWSRTKLTFRTGNPKYVSVQCVGYSGTDGTSPYFADIDNEMESIACTYNGFVDGTQNVSTNVSMFHGTTPLTPTVTVYDGTEDPANQYTSGEAKDGITVTITDGHINVAFANNTDLSSVAKKEFLIKQVAEEQTRYLTFTVNIEKAARPGEHATLYSLVPSADVITKDEYGVPTFDILNFNIIRRVGTTETVITSISDFSSAGLKLYHKVGSGSEVEVTTTYMSGSGAYTNVNYHDIEELYGATNGVIEWILRNTSGQLLDKEGIGSVQDGTSPYFADIDSETDSVACDATGKVNAAYSKDINIRLWHGDTKMELTNILISGTTSAVTATIKRDGSNKITGVTVSVSADTVIPLSTNLTFTPLASGAPTDLSVHFVLNGVRPGADGTQYQRIYKSSSSSTVATPSGDTPSGWSDTPTTINTVTRYRHVSERKSTDGGSTWGQWSPPVIDAYLSEDGTSISIKGSAVGVKTLGQSDPTDPGNIGDIWLKNNNDTADYVRYEGVAQDTYAWVGKTAAIGDGYLIDGYLWMKMNNTTSLSQPRWKNIGLIKGPKGDDGDDAVNVVVSPASMIVEQDINDKNNIQPGADTNLGKFSIQVLKGSTSCTITSITAVPSHVSISEFSNGYYYDSSHTWQLASTIADMYLRGIGSNSSSYYTTGQITLSIEYIDPATNTSKTISGIIAKVYVNLIGTWSETVKGDMKTELAHSSLFDVDAQGNLVEEENWGEFYRSSTQSISRLSRNTDTYALLTNGNECLFSDEGFTGITGKFVHLKKGKYIVYADLDTSDIPTGYYVFTVGSFDFSGNTRIVEQEITVETEGDYLITLIDDLDAGYGKAVELYIAERYSTTSELKQTADEITSEVKAIKNGKNVLSGVLDGTGWRGATNGITPHAITGDVVDNWIPCNSGDVYVVSPDISVKKDTAYTYSFDVPSYASGAITVLVYTTSFQQLFSLASNTSGRRKVTFTPTANTVVMLYVAIGRIHYPQLEAGSEASPFEAPTTAVMSQIKQTSDNIHAAVVTELDETGIDIVRGKVAVLADNFTVGKDGVQVFGVDSNTGVTTLQDVDIKGSLMYHKVRTRGLSGQGDIEQLFTMYDENGYEVQMTGATSSNKVVKIVLNYDVFIVSGAHKDFYQIFLPPARYFAGAKIKIVNGTYNGGSGSPISSNPSILDLCIFYANTGVENPGDIDETFHEQDLGYMSNSIMAGIPFDYITSSDMESTLIGPVQTANAIKVWDNNHKAYGIRFSGYKTIELVSTLNTYLSTKTYYAWMIVDAK